MWGKTGPGQAWGRLITHLADTAGIAAHLWDDWLAPQARASVTRAVGGDPTLARDLLVFAAGAHDVGKASPQFHRKAADRVPPTRLPYGPDWASDTPEGDHLRAHGPVGALAVMRWAGHSRDTDLTRALRESGAAVVAAIVGGHHGYVEDLASLRAARGAADPANPIAPVLGDGYSVDGARSGWIDVQDELVDAAAERAQMTPDRLEGVRVRREGQLLIAGLVAMADWIASNSRWFPLSPARGTPGWMDAPWPSPARVAAGWAAANLIGPRWAPVDISGLPAGQVMASRFGTAQARPMQAAVCDHLAAHHHSGGGVLMLIEDATGSGKTEAGLIAAEILAARSGATGLVVALPTRASSDAMAGRVTAWLDRHTPGASAGLRVTHSHAELNAAITAAAGEEEEVVGDECGCEDDPHDDHGGGLGSWFDGRNRILADITVGTIDHVLALAVRHRHPGIRHLAVAGSVVILDEIHSCDELMITYLEATLGWLGAHQIPVIGLSATLTTPIRARLAAAYTRSHTTTVPAVEDGVPLITTISTDATVHTTHVPAATTRTLTVDTLDLLDADTITRHITDHHRTGVVGLVFDTVDRAITAHTALPAGTPAVLLHSRLTVAERRRREQYVMDVLGPTGTRPDRLVVISTQIIEVSLDLDLDVLYSDIAPIDSLIQRAGRLHRHTRPRPAGLEAPRMIIGGRTPTTPDDNGEAAWEYSAGIVGYQRGRGVYPADTITATTTALRAAGPTWTLPTDTPALTAHIPTTGTTPGALTYTYTPGRAAVRSLHDTLTHPTRDPHPNPVRDSHATDIVLIVTGPDGTDRLTDGTPAPTHPTRHHGVQIALHTITIPTRTHLHAHAHHTAWTTHPLLAHITPIHVHHTDPDTWHNPDVGITYTTTHGAQWTHHQRPRSTAIQDTNQP